jgi:hypothetical protein
VKLPPPVDVGLHGPLGFVVTLWTAGRFSAILRPVPHAVLVAPVPDLQAEGQVEATATGAEESRPTKPRKRRPRTLAESLSACLATHAAELLAERDGQPAAD